LPERRRSRAVDSDFPQRLPPPLLVAAKAKNSTTQLPRSVLIYARGLLTATNRTNEHE
jgi:hypothetical protein